MQRSPHERANQIAYLHGPYGDQGWLDSSESISVDDEFYEYYEQFCADYHSLLNFNKMGGISLVGSVFKHDVNIVELVRNVLEIYKEIVRDLREKAIQNF